MSQRSGTSGRRLVFSPEEEIEFAAIFSIVWALKGTDAYRPALLTLADWRADLTWRRAQVFVAHRATAEIEAEIELERLVRVLRATVPDRIGLGKEAA